MRARPRSDRGSALFLFPVGLVIVLMLGAIVVDFGHAHLARRELSDAASAAANDAVTYGLDQQTLRADGAYRLDPTLARAAVTTSLDRQGLSSALTSVVVDTQAVEVHLQRRVDLPFGGSMTVASTGRATVKTD